MIDAAASVAIAPTASSPCGRTTATAATDDASVPKMPLLDDSSTVLWPHRPRQGASVGDRDRAKPTNPNINACAPSAAWDERIDERRST
jgi:hypothetical protein